MVVPELLADQLVKIVKKLKISHSQNLSTSKNQLAIWYHFFPTCTVMKKSVYSQNRSGQTNFRSQNWSLCQFWSPSENANTKQSKVAS